MIEVDRVQKIKAIPTKYKGVVFRSRLEARWAVYFDYFGIEWLYEFQGFQLDSGCYLPDFWLPQVNHWAEVKPDKLTKLEELKIEDLVIGTGNDCLLLIGVPKCCPTPVVSESLDEDIFLEEDGRPYFENMGYSKQQIEDVFKEYKDLCHQSNLNFLSSNLDRYYVGQPFGTGKTMLLDVVLNNEKLYENRFFSSTGCEFTDKLSDFFYGIEDAVSASLSAKF
jgi:hypothetical protein